MNALALLQEKILLLIERIQLITLENEQFAQKIAQLEKKIATQQATLDQREQTQTSHKDNKQADTIIDGLIYKIDSLLESPR